MPKVVSFYLSPLKKNGKKHLVVIYEKTVWQTLTCQNGSCESFIGKGSRWNDWLTGKPVSDSKKRMIQRLLRNELSI